MEKSKFILEAISLAQESLLNPKRYPFGSVIVKDGQIVGVGKEATRILHDPTAHSEILAIRNACKNLQTTNLKGCVMYSSSEPCSMCLSAIFWSKISTVYFACTREDVHQFGFPDRFKLIEKRGISPEMNLHHIKHKDALQVFIDWNTKQKESNFIKNLKMDEQV